MPLSNIQLKKGEDRRIRNGHPWIFSNEIDTQLTPLKTFTPGQEVIVQSHDGTKLGTGYVNPHSLIAVRLCSREPDTTLDTAFFVKQFETALSLRQRLFQEPYYRLVFGESDFLPGLVVDRFGDDLVVQINTAGMETKIDLIGQALQQVLPQTRSILLRNDSAIRTQEGLELYTKPYFGTPPELANIIENDTHFSVPLWKGQKTGWFYDHRLNRARVKAYVANANVLDVFSYLGGWGIQAAKQGAAHVDCIEVSASAGELIQQNAALNNVADKINVIVDDAFDAMKALLQEGKQYDVILLDPPAFVKKSKDLKEGLLAYQRINELALRLLSFNGVLITSSCSMHVSADDLAALMKRAAYRANCQVQVLERGHQGPDHPIHINVPETDYLKTLILRKMKLS